MTILGCYTVHTHACTGGLDTMCTAAVVAVSDFVFYFVVIVTVSVTVSLSCVSQFCTLYFIFIFFSVVCFIFDCCLSYGNDGMLGW